MKAQLTPSSIPASRWHSYMISAYLLMRSASTEQSTCEESHTEAKAACPAGPVSPILNQRNRLLRSVRALKQLPRHLPRLLFAGGFCSLPVASASVFCRSAVDCTREPAREVAAEPPTLSVPAASCCRIHMSEYSPSLASRSMCVPTSATSPSCAPNLKIYTSEYSSGCAAEVPWQSNSMH